MHFTWDSVPESLESKLMAGTVGKMHLTGLARAALVHPDHAATGVDMLLAAWEADPLDGMLAGQLARFMPEGSGVKALFTGLARAWEPDGSVVRMQQRRKAEPLFSLLADRLADENRTLFHLQRAVELGPSQFPMEWTLRHFDREWPEALMPAVEYARSFAELVAGEVQAARDRCVALYRRLPLPGVMARMGECEYRLGNRDKALDCWRDALVARPWNVSLLLRAHDVATGLDRDKRPLDGRVNIFLYTYNKARELDFALEALAGSDLGDARITVLDNGCTDDTPAVLARWADTFGRDRFTSIVLPVNVGAPAARNWLMRGPDARANPWTVFLDDDAVVGGDWLDRLGAAVHAYPDAGVWGCKVLDAALPHVIQNADLHPRPDYESGRFAVGEMSDLHHQSYDAGGFDFVRPCTSVTGCCHLFRTETLLECGDFDLAYTPSQFDDLDHDLRLALADRGAVYQGHLGVHHMKRSGKLSGVDSVAAACGQANHDKLKARFAPHWETIRRSAMRRLRADVLLKADSLGTR